MSAPATNARSPAPRRTMARVSGSPSSRPTSASSSATSAAESAFIGGLSVVTRATAPWCSVVTNVPNDPPRCRYDGGRGAPRLRGYGELLSQRGLAELADRRLRDLVDGLESLRQPPLGEVRRQECP